MLGAGQMLELGGSRSGAGADQEQKQDRSRAEHFTGSFKSVA